MNIEHEFPGGKAPLRDLRKRLLDRGTSYAVREDVWKELVFRAQSQGGDWPLAAVWMMAPGLRGAAARVVRGGGLPFPDVEAEVIEGFLKELKSIDVDARGVASRLWWAGYRAGLRARATYTGMLRAVPLPEPWALHAQRPTSGHPDFVLDRAVRAGAVTADEAELIGRTRMENEGLADAARRLGIGYTACRIRRAVAEERLARYLVVPGADAGSNRPSSPTLAELAEAA
ncbi:hypothetical protein [Streptomyces violascens]|uniref:Sigma-70 family RNA polymerase sigma factor n=1 Tax=Streptomyces violascens TaxID=67381 RepID=A0ABQ3QYL5_9ACTN|nr:hypothetical protein [Streptomyces violascens]GGU22346.1 hypothetical protein GCM10010289_49800 [Streptomyces violascens]GHI42355.1 hypothetical protein Sviol_67630 [Streptomyces violascens]